MTYIRDGSRFAEYGWDKTKLPWFMRFDEREVGQMRPNAYTDLLKIQIDKYKDFIYKSIGTQEFITICLPKKLFDSLKYICHKDLGISISGTTEVKNKITNYIASQIEKLDIHTDECFTHISTSYSKNGGLQGNPLNILSTIKFKGLSHNTIALFYIHSIDDMEWNSVNLIVAKSDITLMSDILLEASKQENNCSINYIDSHEEDEVVPTFWEDIIIPKDIFNVVVNDIKYFLDNKTWFNKKHLPYKRGYLLHGPPGNGKSSMIRGLSYNYGLPIYTISDFRTCEVNDLKRCFTRAVANFPAMVVLEDLDRVFDKTKEGSTKIDLSVILNLLDGMDQNEGIIVIATANNPQNLDSAILKRPGRFDRVIKFDNPDKDLRQSYFKHLCEESLPIDNIVENTDGFSFAQLKEVYILANQQCFLTDKDLKEEHMLTAIGLLASSINKADIRLGSKTGFTKGK